MTEKRPRMKRAVNPTTFAVGRTTTRGGFMVRTIEWGYTLARSVMREGEEIREAAIMVAPRKVGN